MVSLKLLRLVSSKVIPGQHAFQMLQMSDCAFSHSATTPRNYLQRAGIFHRVAENCYEVQVAVDYIRLASSGRWLGRRLWFAREARPKRFQEQSDREYKYSIRPFSSKCLHVKMSLLRLAPYQEVEMDGSDVEFSCRSPEAATTEIGEAYRLCELSNSPTRKESDQDESSGRMCPMMSIVVGGWSGVRVLFAALVGLNDPC